MIKYLKKKYEDLYSYSVTKTSKVLIIRCFIGLHLIPIQQEGHNIGEEIHPSI